MLKVGLTGNIASGKSAVARTWRSRGAHIVESDELARRAVAPGTQALRKIQELWGPGVLLETGELDRAALRDVVFRNDDERRRLEEIIHPEVHRLHLEAYEDAQRRGLDIIVADIPLLYEVGREGEFDVVVLVDAPDDVRRARLVQNRGLTEEEAQRMIEAQWPSESKRGRATFVIDNIGTLRDLEARAAEVWSALKLRARARRPNP
jgi:dephospho-CoA kinase